jgi:hypothetical protein
MSYPLYQGSEYNISGNVTFKETKDKSTVIILNLNGTENGLLHPVHLHFDNITGNGEIASVLNPVNGKSGISTTTLGALDNNSSITYSQLLEMEASIKIHLSDTEPGKNIILAGGNIGISDSKSDPFGRFEISICKSN